MKRMKPLEMTMISKSCAPLRRLPRDKSYEDYEVTPTDSVSCSMSIE